MKPFILLLSGLQGSGKSKRAVEWVDEAPGERERINYDTLRLEMFGPDWVWNRDDETQMQMEATKRCRDFLAAGKSVVIDNLNLADKARKLWHDVAIIMGVDVVEEELDTPVAVCVGRDANREGKARVGRAVIERAALDYGFIDLKAFPRNPRDYVIVDMDGTLADCSARREAAREGVDDKHKTDCVRAGKKIHRKCQECGAKQRINWDRFYDGVINDPVIEPVRNLVYLLSKNYDIIVVSGRPIDKAGKSTEEWLRKNLNVTVKHLFMRRGGDSRPDYVIKQEILDLMNCTERIRYCIDDRDQVVRMWRQNNLTCLQVADGDF